MASAGTLERLLALAARLRSDNAAFLDEPGDNQMWYDRGYGSGILAALDELGYGDAVGDQRAGEAEEVAPHRALAWGQAYDHGFETGRRETFEVIGPRE